MTNPPTPPAKPYMTKEVWRPEDLADFLEDAQASDNDYTILLDGRKGCGKSTLAKKVCKAVNKEQFALQKHIILTPDPQKIAIHMAGLDKSVCVSVDEAIGSFYVENWNRGDQKGLHIYLNQFQRKDKNTVVIFCIPHNKDFRGPFMRSSVNMWIHIYKKGRAVIFLPSADANLDDPWLRDTNTKKWNRKAKEKNRHQTYQQYAAEFQEDAYRTYSTFFAFLRFDKDEDAEYREYMDYVKANKDEISAAIFADAEDNKMKTELRKLKVQRLREKLSEEKKITDPHISKEIKEIEQKRQLWRMKLNLYTGEKRKIYLKKLVWAKNKLVKLTGKTEQTSRIEVKPDEAMG